jgi:hypothetical protein
MRVASGKIVHGKVLLQDAAFPEGASVTVLFPDEGETFEADSETEKMLLQSIAQCERGNTVPFDSVLARLRRKA